MPSTAQRSKPKAKPKKVASKRKPEAPKPKTPRKTVEEIAETPRLVSYYLEGWRFGYREGSKGDHIIIQPIGPLSSPAPRTIRVPATDVREIRKEST